MTGRPLNAEEIEERLEEHVDAVLSSRRTAAGPALRLAEFDRTRQDFVLKWVDTIAKTHAEMAYQFADYASLALRRVDSEGVEAWIIQAMDAFDNKGLTAGIAVLQDLQAFAAQRKQRATGLSFEAIQGVLENFIRGADLRREKRKQAWLGCGFHGVRSSTLFRRIAAVQGARRSQHRDSQRRSRWEQRARRT